jgi:DNA (cytosine-5)-methyltransferase 1
MTDRSESGPSGALDPCLYEVPKEERRLHREFISRHIDFLIDVLTAEQHHQHWPHPAGCPTATPVKLARRRGDTGEFPCRYRTITTPETVSYPDAECECGDWLGESTDPLDTVAAVSIAPDGESPAERYFDDTERRIIASIREDVGAWEEIAALSRDELQTALTDAGFCKRTTDQTLDRLWRLIDAVSETEKTDGVTLEGIRPMPYSSLCSFLAELPGISERDGWWLLPVAFDKPVWPADPHVDRLLCSLGLLHPSQLQTECYRQTELEDELTDRQLPALHRALAGHAVHGGIDSCDEECEIRKFLLSHRLREQDRRDHSLLVVDLFSGAGGISLGFDRAGHTIHWALDNNRDATDTYRLNHPEIPHERIRCEDIQDAAETGQFADLDVTPDIVVGGPPCQALSLAGYRSRLASDEEYSVLDDERTTLYQQYVEAIRELRPKVLVMENVEGMVNEVGETGVCVIDQVLDSLRSLGDDGPGYICEYQLLNCADLGIPQERERVIILGVRDDITDGEDDLSDLFTRIRETAPDSLPSLRQGLSGLPKIRRGEGGTVIPGTVRGRRSEYVDRNELDSVTSVCFNHRAREHPMDKDQKLFDEVMSPGDTGWDIKYNTEYGHLIEYDVGTEENPRFKDKYRMLDWEDSAPTIVAHLAKDANSFILPDYYDHVSQSPRDPDNERNRGITPREAARLQSFPDDYIFLGPFTSWFRQIGNAVPPLLGQYIGEAVRTYLAAHDTPSAITSGQHPASASTDD